MKRQIHDSSYMPDLLVERYRLGEMSPSEIERFHRHLLADQDLQGRLQALDRSDEDIAQQYPDGWLAAQVRRRLRRKDPCYSLFAVHRHHRYVSIAVAVVALVLLGIGWGLLDHQWSDLQPGTSDSLETGERLKGHKLVLFRKTAEGSEVLGDGDTVRVGDQIRIGYRAAGHAYGMIFSIDGRGVVIRHFPPTGNQSAALTHKGQVLLDHAYELDDAPGWEKFYLVSAPEVFDIAPIMEAARNLARNTGERMPAGLILSASLDQSCLILRKEIIR